MISINQIRNASNRRIFEFERFQAFLLSSVDRTHLAVRLWQIWCHSQNQGVWCVKLSAFPPKAVPSVARVALLLQNHLAAKGQLEDWREIQQARHLVPQQTRAERPHFLCSTGPHLYCMYVCILVASGSFVDIENHKSKTPIQHVLQDCSACRSEFGLSFGCCSTVGHSSLQPRHPPFNQRL